jgi:thioredoxin-like negative regulator of GroEL
MCLVSFAFAAELPEVELGWHGATGWITARPPAGEHVAPEAPVTAELWLGEQRVVVDASGLELQDGLRLALPPGVSSVEGTLSLSLCEDGGTTCRLVNVGFDLPISGWRGRARQPGVALDSAEASPPMYAVEGAVEAAFARAKSDERLVLLDFSAVWCPPCNLLAAEVLHDPDDAEVLAPFVVAVVDVDAPWSWTLKDRYAVGAYPTLIVTDVDGAVIDRMEGYPGEEAFEAWLTKVQGGMLPLDQLAAKGLTMTPDEAAAAALRLARAGRVDEAKALLPPGLTTADALLTRLALSPDEATLTQLCVLAPERVYEYAFAALDLEALSAEGAATPLGCAGVAGCATAPSSPMTAGTKPCPTAPMMRSASSRLIGNAATMISTPLARGSWPVATCATMPISASTCAPLSAVSLARAGSATRSVSGLNAGAATGSNGSAPGSGCATAGFAMSSPPSSTLQAGRPSDARISLTRTLPVSIASRVIGSESSKSVSKTGSGISARRRL